MFPRRARFWGIPRPGHETSNGKGCGCRFSIQSSVPWLARHDRGRHYDGAPTGTCGQGHHGAASRRNDCWHRRHVKRTHLDEDGPEDI